MDNVKHSCIICNFNLLEEDVFLPYTRQYKCIHNSAIMNHYYLKYYVKDKLQTYKCTVGFPSYKAEIISDFKRGYTLVEIYDYQLMPIIPTKMISHPLNENEIISYVRLIQKGLAFI